MLGGRIIFPERVCSVVVGQSRVLQKSETGGAAESEKSKDPGKRIYGVRGIEWQVAFRNRTSGACARAVQPKMSVRTVLPSGPESGGRITIGASLGNTSGNEGTRKISGSEHVWVAKTSRKGVKMHFFHEFPRISAKNEGNRDLRVARLVLAPPEAVFDQAWCPPLEPHPICPVQRSPGLAPALQKNDTPKTTLPPLCTRQQLCVVS